MKLIVDSKNNFLINKPEKKIRLINNIYFTVYQSQSCGPSMSLYNLPPNKTRKLTRVKVSLFHHVDLYPVTGLQNWFCLFYTFILNFEYLHRHQQARPPPTKKSTTRNTLQPTISRSIDEVSANVAN